MDEITVVFPDSIGQYGFHYPRTAGKDVPIRVPTKYLHPHPSANEKKFRMVKDFTPLIVKSDTGVATVWRKNA